MTYGMHRHTVIDVLQIYNDDDNGEVNLSVWGPIYKESYDLS